jgi:AcrR family transcriptional regulator
MGRGEDKRGAILRAALARFARYGFRRTSMEDIAREADISRAAVYLQFRNKEEIFRALARQLHEQALGAAASAAREPGPIAARLRRVLEAKLATMFDVVHDSLHAAELLDENNRICGDISAEAARRYLQRLTGVIAAAVRSKELTPRRAGLSPAAAAEMIVQCAQGIKTSGGAALTPGVYRQRLDQLVRVIVAGLGGKSAPSRGVRARPYRGTSKEERA